MQLSRVVLPAPLGPMMAHTSPRGIVRLTRLRATSAPNLTLMPSTASKGPDSTGVVTRPPPGSQARLACGCGSHYLVHRLASPAAAARTTWFTGSPRLRLRLALPGSQARLACGCGSHYLVHRLASSAAAAR